MTATTSNEKLQAWVSEWAEIFQPDAIHWCDGTEAEYDALCQQMVDAAPALASVAKPLMQGAKA